MQSVTVGNNQAGQRLDKFLHKCLPNAGSSFLYKMLRKKNITLNGKKAEGKEMLSVGDEIKFFFSDETFEQFVGRENVSIKENGQNAACSAAEHTLQKYLSASYFFRSIWTLSDRFRRLFGNLLLPQNASQSGL